MAENGENIGVACVVKVKRRNRFFRWKTVDRVAVFFTNKTKVVHNGNSIDVMERVRDVQSRYGSESSFQYTDEAYTKIASMKAFFDDKFTVTRV